MSERAESFVRHSLEEKDRTGGRVTNAGRLGSTFPSGRVKKYSPAWTSPEMMADPTAAEATDSPETHPEQDRTTRTL
jgi:hypothetical protein